MVQVQVMITSAYWWSSLQKSLEEVTLFAVIPLLIGPLFQYGGRWGLYEYINIRYFLGYPGPGPGDTHYDAFETRKQKSELTAFVLGAIVSLF